MKWRDKEKLIRAGYMIIRERDYNPVAPDHQSERPYPYHIVKCSSNSAWTTIERYKTKEERRREMDRLLESDRYLED